jgi:hypothetical protein
MPPMKPRLAVVSRLLVVSGLLGAGTWVQAVHAQERADTRRGARSPLVVSRLVATEDLKRIRAQASTMASNWRRGAAAGRASRNRALLGAVPGGSEVTRLLHVAPQLPPSGRPITAETIQWNATVYDYGEEKGYAVTLAPNGSLLSVNALADQPPPSKSELASAVEVLHQHSVYGPLLKAGKLKAYAAMPAVDPTPGAPRTLNVGLLPREPGAVHEIVGVRLGKGSVISYATAQHSPDTAIATDEICGIDGDDACPSSDESDGGVYRVQWPNAADPIWDVVVVRPAATVTSLLPRGAGVELREARYRGSLVLLTANVPVLNVKYEGDTCGPFRDWLYDESCVALNGAPEVNPGFFITTSPAGTICNTHSDSGTGRGVVLETSEDSLTIVSEMSAAWYRYLNGWRLRRDGTIDAIFQYAGTVNSCMCHRRTHHAYWRLDWALGAKADANSPTGWSGSARLERRKTPSDAWQAVVTEETSYRTSPDAAIRVADPSSHIAYEIVPSPNDGTAAGDAFGKSDVWLLRWNEQEVGDTRLYPEDIDLDPYLNAEPFEPGRVVTWYAGHMRQDGNVPGNGGVCTTLGPTFRRVVVQ